MTEEDDGQILDRFRDLLDDLKNAGAIEGACFSAMLPPFLVLNRSALEAMPGGYDEQVYRFFSLTAPSCSGPVPVFWQGFENQSLVFLLISRECLNSDHGKHIYALLAPYESPPESADIQKRTLVEIMDYTASHLGLELDENYDDYHWGSTKIH